MTALLLLLDLLAPGCKGTIHVDTGNPPIGGETGGTDTGDTGQRTGPRVELRFSGGDPTGLRFGAMLLDLGSDLLPLGESFSAGIDASPAEIALPTPTGDLVDLDPENWPGTTAAIYAPIAYLDADASSSLSRGSEEILGVSTGPLLIYLDGPLPDDLASLGASSGWNIVLLDPSAPYPGFQGIDAGLDMAVYDPAATLTVGGTDETLPPDRSLLAALVPMTDSQSLPSSLLGDGEDPAWWSFTVAGSPPADHLFVDTNTSLEMAAEFPLAYRDMDGSGGLTNGDLPQAYACEGGAVALLAFVSPPLDPIISTLAPIWGLRIGWQAVTVTGPDEPPLPVSDPTALVFDPDACSLD